MGLLDDHSAAKFESSGVRGPVGEPPRPTSNRAPDTSAASKLDPTDAFLKGYGAGSEMVVLMMRAGNLRLAALPFERGEYPYNHPLRPFKATALIWRSWWRERTNRG